MKKVQILLCVHKKSLLPTNNIFLPIQVGKAISNLDLGFTADNSSEDNISEKNPSYCETTAMYWAWKSLKDVDIIGLCHYRRYFKFGENSNNKAIYNKPLENIDTCNSISEEQITQILSSHDIILALPEIFPYSVYIQYCMNHIAEDIAILSKVLRTHFEEYYPAFETVMSGNSFSPYNMFITDKQTFDQYCSWLFDVLSKVEKYIPTSGYKRQSRTSGYLAERLLNIFCIHKKLKIKYLPINYFYAPNEPKFDSLTFKEKMQNRIVYKISSKRQGKVSPPSEFDKILDINGIVIE